MPPGGPLSQHQLQQPQDGAPRGGTREAVPLLVQLGIDHELIPLHRKRGQEVRVLEGGGRGWTSLPACPAVVWVLARGPLTLGVTTACSRGTHHSRFPLLQGRRS